MMNSPEIKFGFAPLDYVVKMPTRKLETLPSTKMAALLKEQPQLLKDFNGEVCDMFEYNVIKVLLIKAKQRQFKQEFKMRIGSVSKSINNPFRVLKNIKFRTTESKKIYVTETIIYKDTVGPLTGIVTTGEYAGLVINFNQENSLKVPGVANKIWCTNSNMRYARTYSIQIGDIKPPEDEAFHLKINVTRSILDDIYISWLKETKGKVDSTTDHLFHLCNLLDVPIDTAQFHSSLPLYK